MLFRKNLPTWERVLRLVAAAAMGLCAWRFGATPVGITFGAMAVVAALTAFLGFCPACALARRKLDAQARSRAR